MLYPLSYGRMYREDTGGQPRVRAATDYTTSAPMNNKGRSANGTS